MITTTTTTTTTTHQLLLLFHSTACSNSSSKHRCIIHCAPTELWSLSSMNNDDHDHLIMISMTLERLLRELSFKNWELEKGLASSFSLSQHGKRWYSYLLPLVVYPACRVGWVQSSPPQPPTPPPLQKRNNNYWKQGVFFFFFPPNVVM
jgi:hypothetical protein